MRLILEEQGGSRLYLGRGDENGLVLQEIMPATYSYTVTAFGYLPAQGTVAIHGSGNFSFADIPYGSHVLSFARDQYHSRQVPFTLNTAALDIGAVESAAIPAGSEGAPDLGSWTHAAWNRVDSFPGFLDAPSYKITTTYGAFDVQGSMLYSLSGDAADFSGVTLLITGRKWYY